MKKFLCKDKDCGKIVDFSLVRIPTGGPNPPWEPEEYKLKFNFKKHGPVYLTCENHHVFPYYHDDLLSK